MAALPQWALALIILHVVAGTTHVLSSHHEQYRATGESVLIPGFELTNTTIHELKKVGGPSNPVAIYHAGDLPRTHSETRGHFFKNGSFLLKNLTQSDSGVYVHVMHTHTGVERQVITNLTVIDPVEQPVLHVEHQDGQVLLKCVGAGEKVSFFLDNLMINKTSEADNVLLLEESQTRTGGNYTCELSNKVSRKTSTPHVIHHQATASGNMVIPNVAVLTCILIWYIISACIKVLRTDKCFTYKSTCSTEDDYPEAWMGIIFGLRGTNEFVKRFVCKLGVTCNGRLFRVPGCIPVIIDVSILGLCLFAIITFITKYDCPEAWMGIIFGLRGTNEFVKRFVCKLGATCNGRHFRVLGSIPVIINLCIRGLCLFVIITIIIKYDYTEALTGIIFGLCGTNEFVKRFVCKYGSNGRLFPVPGCIPVIIDVSILGLCLFAIITFITKYDCPEAWMGIIFGLRGTNEFVKRFVCKLGATCNGRHFRVLGSIPVIINLCIRGLCLFVIITIIIKYDYTEALTGIIFGLCGTNEFVKRFVCKYGSNGRLFPVPGCIPVIIDVSILGLCLFAIITFITKFTGLCPARTYKVWKLCISLLIPLVLIIVLLIISFFCQRKLKERDSGAVEFSAVNSDDDIENGNLELLMTSQRDPPNIDVDDNSAGDIQSGAKSVGSGGKRDDEEMQEVSTDGHSGIAGETPNATSDGSDRASSLRREPLSPAI